MNPVNRRRFMAQASAALVAAPAIARSEAIRMPFANGDRPLVRLPQKRPLIGLTMRPPQLETPFPIFNDGILTPNDAFFVRYHLSDLPTTIDPATYRLSIGGHVGAPLFLSLAQLKRDFPVQEIVAVNQCSGNSRAFSDPRVGGGQLGNGAMGNACWRGVSLRVLLDRAGVRAGARQVTFNGLDAPPVETIPDFVKALDIDHARNGEVMVAWSMNDADLPFLNGYPLRLIVPGYYGTYWVKHLHQITVVDRQYDGYWMKTAYRIPDNDCHCVAPGQKPDKTVPIASFNIRSFITSHQAGERVVAGRGVPLRGIAFNGGAGIARVQLSINGGRDWQDASLGQDHGRYAFREWRFVATFPKGQHDVKVRAVGNDGEIQPPNALWQPAGYMRNVVETVQLEAI